MKAADEGRGFFVEVGVDYGQEQPVCFASTKRALTPQTHDLAASVGDGRYHS